MAADPHVDPHNCLCFPKYTEMGNLGAAHTRMANTTAHVSEQSQMRHSAYMADAMAMWGINMTTPSQNSALALRTAQEAGSGATRVNANVPAGSQTVGGTLPNP